MDAARQAPCPRGNESAVRWRRAADVGSAEGCLLVCQTGPWRLAPGNGFMIYDFDRPVDRRHSTAPSGTCTARMCSALDRRHGLSRGRAGFGRTPRARRARRVRILLRAPELREVIVERLARLYDWRVEPAAILFQTGVLAGFQHVCRVAARPQDAVLVQPPVYPPSSARRSTTGPSIRKRRSRCAPTAVGKSTSTRSRPPPTIARGSSSCCNPHNPVGRVFSRADLERLAAICLGRDMLICSDEIHCDLVFDGQRTCRSPRSTPTVAVTR